MTFVEAVIVVGIFGLLSLGGLLVVFVTLRLQKRSTANGHDASKPPPPPVA